MTDPSGSAAPAPPHVLLVDDDERILALLARYLAENGFRVTTVTDAAGARLHLGLIRYDLIVLDVMMPGEDGLSLMTSLNGRTPTPVLMLTAMGQADDRIRGLESGADDYLTKPFDPRELVLRLRSILRRTGSGNPSRETMSAASSVCLGRCVFDRDRNELRAADTRSIVHLTTAELSLLRVLADRPGQTVSREDLATLTGAEGGPRTIDVQITRLRKKLEDDARTPRYIRTVRGRGYQLMPD